MIIRTARPPIVPRDIAKIEKKAPTVPLASPIKSNFAG